MRAGGVPLSGAVLTVADGPNAGQTTATNSAGTFAFPPLEQSGFTLRTALAGYDADSRAVTLTSETTLDIVLQKTPAAFLTYSGNLTVTPNTDGTWRLTGTMTNTGDACATNISGTMRLDLDGVTVTTLPIAPLTITLPPGGTGQYGACCLAPSSAGRTFTYVTFFSFDSSRC